MLCKRVWRYSRVYVLANLEFLPSELDYAAAPQGTRGREHVSAGTDEVRQTPLVGI